MAFGTPSVVTQLDASGVSDLAQFILPDHSAIYFVSSRNGTNSIYRSARTNGVFQVPVLVDGTNLNTGGVDYPVPLPDELTLYSSNGFGNDVLVATRTDTNARFGAGAPLDGVNSAANEWPLFLSSDQCSLYLASARPGGLGGMDIWVARRGD